jgi:hypothetical protein
LDRIFREEPSVIHPPRLPATSGPLKPSESGQRRLSGHLWLCLGRLGLLPRRLHLDMVLNYHSLRNLAWKDGHVVVVPNLVPVHTRNLRELARHDYGLVGQTEHAAEEACWVVRLLLGRLKTCNSELNRLLLR